jgi:hypothetical protein
MVEGPNISVKTLVLLVHSRQVPYLNLGPEVSNPDFCGISPSLQMNAKAYLKEARSFTFNISQIVLPFAST